MSALASSPTGLTWDQFLALPHELRNVALVDGEVVVNPPNAPHEMIVRNLNVAFTLWTRAAKGRGNVSTQQPVKINDRRGYQPDFAWYPPERCAQGWPPSFSGLPELVVEVLSPSTRSFDQVRKRGDYERIGIGELWLVDPERQTVLVLRRLEPGAPYSEKELGVGDVVTSPLLDGLDLPVAALFEP